MKNAAEIRTISDISINNLKNKRVLLRADFNVPIGSDGTVDEKEDWRIKAVLPTIEYFLKCSAKIIIMSHLGRPGGKIVENLRMGPIQDKLSELLALSVSRTSDCLGSGVSSAISEMAPGEILMLENLRFHKEEESNDEKFAEELASLGDLYINDAFADSHRKHASIAAITKFLPSCAGLLLEHEIKTLTQMLTPKRPAVAIIGGAKLETKLPAVKALAKIYDHVLVGGMIANEILQISIAQKISPNVILPIPDSLAGQKYFDIGENSVKEFSVFIQKAKTIIWNGPMGKFEDARYRTGTKGLIELVKSAHVKGGTVLIGGGETIYALQKFAPELMDKKLKDFHISTGGGAMLDFLAGEELPGIEALHNK